MYIQIDYAANFIPSTPSYFTSSKCLQISMYIYSHQVCTAHFRLVASASNLSLFLFHHHTIFFFCPPVIMMLAEWDMHTQAHSAWMNRPGPSVFSTNLKCLSGNNSIQIWLVAQLVKTLWTYNLTCFLNMFVNWWQYFKQKWEHYYKWQAEK